MQIVQVPLAELKFADYNPRKITERQVEDLKASIKEFGVVEPIVVNKHEGRENIIVGGHQRARILGLLEYTTVPVFYVDLDEVKERELNIRLNKNTGEFDWEKLANEFAVEDLLDYGFTNNELGLADDAKDDIDRDNLGASLDSYLEGNIKQIVLYFKNEEYADVISRLEKIGERESIDNDNTLTFLKLLECYEEKHGIVVESHEDTGAKE